MLLLLSWVYALGMATRGLLYSLKVLKRRKLSAKVICIGNITTGGTGKTPTVLLAAQTLRRKSLEVAILSRGYGRLAPGAEVTTLVDGRSVPWSRCGDEPWMMHQALHGQNIPILVSANRLKAGQEAIRFYHSRLLILDDGFQHLAVKPDLSIVLINATDPFGGGKLLPLGNLREPLSSLKRADMVVITHVDRVSDKELEAIRKRIASVAPKMPLIEAEHKADFLFDLKTERKFRLAHLAEQKVVSLCGIADPKSFEEQLEKIGCKVTQRWRYPDHHAYRLRELRAVEKLRGGLPVITTFKDMPRLPKGWQSVVSGEIFALAVKLDIVKGKNLWLDKLDRLADEALA